MLTQLPHHLLQAGAIFLSIIIEALPFVLIGAVISGFIEVYVTPDKVAAYLPKRRSLQVLVGTFLGFFFPSCECGIVPIVSRFLEKKVPSYTAVPFLATAPIINPIVIFSTYTAFGNSVQFALLRVLGAISTALALGILVGFMKDPELLKPQQRAHSHTKPFEGSQGWAKFGWAWVQAVEEFFDTGRYLVLGCAFAAAVQVYVPTRLLVQIGHNPLTAVLLMMLLAFLLSVCSEADAFIGASLLSSFGMAPVMAFLVYGPMIDIKNLLMMQAHLKSGFIWRFIATISLVILAYGLLLGVI